MLPLAVLPNPAEPSFIGIGAALGALVGRTLAWALGYAADNRMQWALDGSYYGTGVALGVYLVVNFLEAGCS
jgi:membrane protein YqaA with SNARE-associated domain